VRAGWNRLAAAGCGAVLALALVPGCALLTPPPAPATKQLLNKMPAEVPQRASQGAVLLVFPPRAGSIYDTTQMAYTPRLYEIAYFSEHEWAGTPAQMLHPLLVRTMQDTRFFSAVLAPPHAGRYDYALRTEIGELVADFSSQPAAMRLSLRVHLSDDATRRIIASKEIAIRETMPAMTPAAGVAAANEATAKALLELARFVLEQAGRP
jgi:cholesterol transport system auxiliary component